MYHTTYRMKLRDKPFEVVTLKIGHHTEFKKHNHFIFINQQGIFLVEWVDFI